MSSPISATHVREATTSGSSPPEAEVGALTATGSRESGWDGLVCVGEPLFRLGEDAAFGIQGGTTVDGSPWTALPAGPPKIGGSAQAACAAGALAMLAAATSTAKVRKRLMKGKRGVEG